MMRGFKMSGGEAMLSRTNGNHPSTIAAYKRYTRATR